MNPKSSAIQFLLLFTIIAVPSLVQAQRLPFGRAKTTESGDLRLTEEAGPWVIMCTSFVGEDGLQQANRLAQELRREHHLNAYVYTHEFNFDKQLSQGLGWEVVKTTDQRKTIRPIQMKPLNNQSKFEEIAVLVGDFPSIEDPKAQRTLEKIKQLQPQSLSNFDVRDATESDVLAGEKLRAWRGFANMMSADPDAQQKGPLLAAFLLTNPLLPDEYFAARKIDHFVLDLNKDVKYSLLKNPGMYSVKVASFSGDTTLDLNEIQKIQQEESYRKRNRKAITQSKLVDAAKKATLLTHELRNKGIEAYEFHDRHESYVCVGEFDWLTQEDSNGVKRNNPAIEETILKFKGDPAHVPGQQNATIAYSKLSPKLTAAGVVCDAQPLPVLIPKAQETKTASRFFGKFR